MSVTGNPTPLRLGASGMLDGRRYTVRGRVVMSVMLDDETYYWNEFNLVDDSGGAITLVYESTEEGVEWKLFKLFEPLRPLAASAAASVRVGDELELGDRRARVTMVDESRVVFVEGEAPEGIYQGSSANCINADVGDRMIVVSWTGDEVEYYEGSVTSALRIQSAFGLPNSAVFNRTGFDSAGAAEGWDFGALKIAAVVIGVLVFAGYAVFQDEGDSAPTVPPKRMVSLKHLPTGAKGVLKGRLYRIRGHGLVEISRLGDRFDEHEYALSTAEDDRAMLVKALQGKSTDWYLLKPSVTPAGFGPFQAAALREGRVGSIGNRSTPVMQLFQARVLNNDGEDLKILWPAGVQYGFLAGDSSNLILVRWNADGLQFCTVETVSDNDVHAAFGSDQ